MPRFSKQELDDRYNRLPPELQETLYSPDAAEKTFAIGKKFALTISQIGLLAEESGYMTLGLTHPEEYAQNLARELRIDLEKAKLVAADMSHQVFFPLREILKQTHSFDLSPDIIQKAEPLVGSRPPSAFADAMEGKPAAANALADKQAPILPNIGIAAGQSAPAKSGAPQPPFSERLQGIGSALGGTQSSPQHIDATQKPPLTQTRAPAAPSAPVFPVVPPPPMSTQPAQSVGVSAAMNVPIPAQQLQAQQKQSVQISGAPTAVPAVNDPKPGGFLSSWIKSPFKRGEEEKGVPIPKSATPGMSPQPTAGSPALGMAPHTTVKPPVPSSLFGSAKHSASSSPLTMREALFAQASQSSAAKAAVDNKSDMQPPLSAIRPQNAASPGLSAKVPPAPSEQPAATGKPAGGAGLPAGDKFAVVAPSFVPVGFKPLAQTITPPASSKPVSVPAAGAPGISTVEVEKPVTAPRQGAIAAQPLTSVTPVMPITSPAPASSIPASTTSQSAAQFPNEKPAPPKPTMQEIKPAQPSQLSTPAQALTIPQEASVSPLATPPDQSSSAAASARPAYEQKSDPYREPVE